MSGTGTKSAALIGILAALLACKRFTGGDDAKEAPSAAAPAAVAPAGSAEDGPVCTVEKHEVLTKAVNTRTGLTPAFLDDGRVLVGVAIGNHPHVVTIETDGDVDLRAIALKEGSQLAKRLPSSQGQRDLQRVTPVLRSGQVAAYADYRDKYESGRRRIHCGHAESDDTFLVFDGTPVTKQAEEEKKAAAAEKKAERTRRPRRVRLRRLDTVSARPVPGGGAGATPAPKDDNAATGDDEREVLREVRDCRTFSDPLAKDVWSVGTELAGKPVAGGEREWKMSFFSRRGNGRRHLLFDVDLGKTPDKLYTFEAPVAKQLAGGSYVLTARYRGSLYVWLLSLEKQRRELEIYRAGYPSLPRIVPEGMDHLILTSVKEGDDRWKLGFLRLTGGEPDLAKQLTHPTFDVGVLSQGEPTIAKSGSQRWLAFHGGDRRRGELHVVPVDATLSPVGKPFRVTDESTEVYESYVFAQKDGKILALYLTRGQGGGSDLVADVLGCTVKT